MFTHYNKILLILQLRMSLKRSSTEEKNEKQQTWDLQQENLKIQETLTVDLVRNSRIKNSVKETLQRETQYIKTG